MDALSRFKRDADLAQREVEELGEKHSVLS
jgi:hypothetical protein